MCFNYNYDSYYLPQKTHTEIDSTRWWIINVNESNDDRIKKNAFFCEYISWIECVFAQMLIFLCVYSLWEREKGRESKKKTSNNIDEFDVCVCVWFKFIKCQGFKYHSLHLNWIDRATETAEWDRCWMITRHIEVNLKRKERKRKG